MVVKKHETSKIVGLGGDLILYYVFCAYFAYALYFLIKGLYISISDGTGTSLSVLFFIIAIIDAILLIISLDFIFQRKILAKWFSVAFLIIGFILYTIILLMSLGSTKFNDTRTISILFVVMSLIWIFYFFTSERVKNTFLK